MSKPPTQYAGVVGIEPKPIELTPARPVIDWRAIAALPPFQMFAAEVAPNTTAADSLAHAVAVVRAAGDLLSRAGFVLPVADIDRVEVRYGDPLRLIADPALRLAQADIVAVLLPEGRDGLRIELWTSDLMGTWTALHHGADGISCIVASGVDWTPEVSPEELIHLAIHEVTFGW